MGAVAGASETAPAASIGSPLDRSTHFAFEHKLFQLANAHFVLNAADGTAVLRVKLGDLDAVLTLPTVRAEFDITKESHDGQLLAIVEKGLRYVKEIRPG